MDQEKRIRISTDISPLRDLRREIQGLYKELGELKSLENNPGTDQEMLKEVIQRAKRDLSLSLARERSLVTGKPNAPFAQGILPIQGQEIGLIPDSSFLQRQRTSSQETSQLQRETVPVSQGGFITSAHRRSREIDSRLRDLRNQHPIIGDPKVDPWERERQDLLDEEDRLNRGTTQRTETIRRGRLIGPYNESFERPTSPQGLQIDSSGAMGRTPVVTDNTEDLLEDIRNEIRRGNDLTEAGNNSLNEIERNREPSENIPPTRVTPSREENPVVPRPPVSEEEREEQEERRYRRYRGFDFNGIPTALLYGALQSYGAAVNSRNTFEAGAAEIGAIGRTGGSLVSILGRMGGGALNAIPGIGPVLGSIVGGAGDLGGAAISGITSLVSSYAARAVGKAEEMENNVRLYSQTAGVSNREAKSMAFREGSYAARDLGIDVGTYLNRRAQLLRAAGGKILGATEEDISGRREAESQLAVQRLYGLSEGSMMQLQSSMRFATKGSVALGTSSDSPSGIIRAFENTMKELKLPFSEIASTMDESLNTFNQTASHILERAGEFDAGKVATILSNLRVFTGTEGRQLERIQKAVTGQEIAQDDVTQALLMRVARELSPNASFSGIMEKIETMGDDPEFQVSFLQRLDQMVDSNEQLAQVMKAVFPGLHWQDIRKMIESRDREILKGKSENGSSLDYPRSRSREEGWDYLKERGLPEVTEGNEKDFQYKRNAARRTVGVIEAATASKSNIDAANGEKMLGVLSDIDSKIIKLVANTDLMQDTALTINAILEFLVGGDSKKSEEKPPVQQNNPGIVQLTKFLLDKLNGD